MAGEGSVRSDKDSTFPEQEEGKGKEKEKEISSKRRSTFSRPALRPIVTCSPTSSPSSSSSSFSCSSASSSPCSVFRASKSVENSSNSDNISDTEASCSGEEICTTPKAKECRIPEFLPCPPAPRKRRVGSRFHSVPLTGFFIPPDLDSMFSMQKRKISVNI